MNYFYSNFNFYKKLSLLFWAANFLVMHVIILNAQDYWISDKGPSGYIEDGRFYSFNSRIYFIDGSDFSRGMYYSDDEGLNWSEYIIPQINNLTNIRHWNNDTIFVSKYMQGIYFSSDGGVTWQQRVVGLNNYSISFIHFNSSRLFVGTNSGIYFSDNFGESWTISAFSNDYVEDIFSHSDGMIYIKLSWSEPTFVSTNNGIGWQELPYTFENGFTDINGVDYCYDRKKIYKKISALAYQTVYSFSHTSIRNMIEKNDSVFLVQCWNNNFYSLTKGGALLDSFNLHHPHLNNLIIESFALYKNHLTNSIFSYFNEGLVYSNNLGQTWFFKFDVKTKRKVSHLINFDNSFLAAESSSNEIFVRDNLTNSWYRKPIQFGDKVGINGTMYNIYYFGQGQIYICAERGVYYSTNYGVSYDTLIYLQNSKFLSLYKKGDTIAIGTLGGNSLILSVNNFQSYYSKNISSGLGDEHTVYDIEKVGNNRFIISAGKVYYSNDFFNIIWSTSTAYTLRPRTFFVSNTGKIFWLEAKLHASTNDGLSWNLITTSFANPNQMVQNNLNDLFLATDNGIYKSVDDGITWENITYNLPTYRINSVAIDSIGHLYVGTYGYSVYRTLHSTTSVKDKNKIQPDGFTLYQNYPNPFNPTTKIKFSIPSDVKTRRGVSLRVFDILGREVATLVNEEKPAGEHEVEFNNSQLPSGIYYYQLRAGSFTQTKKMILLR